jgi:hypothetical protein
VGSAVGNLGIIGTDVGVKGLPDHAAGIDTESAKISTAMRLTSEETAPTLTAAEWADTKKALAKLKADNAAMQSAINTAEKAAKEADERAAAASAMVEAKNAEIAKQSERVKEAEATAFAWYKGVAWASLGTALVGILGALAAFGVPGTGPISALVGTFTKAFHKPTYAAAEQLPVARTVVQGADVAFTALKHLDAVLASKPDVRAVVATAMRGMTGDQCDTLECFVKTFAKANATDAGMSRAADQFLGQLRDSADTSGGAHSTFTTILSAFQKKADVLGNVSAMIRAVT